MTPTNVRVATVPETAGATRSEVDPRPVVRCARCRLVQFQASHNRCRRCYHPFEVEVVPPPAPVQEEVHPNIAAGVRSWRRVRGLTQKQLACAAHLPRTYISRIENGRILPGLTTLERVAGALHVGLPALLDRLGNGLRREGNGANGAASGLAGLPLNGYGQANGNGRSGRAPDFSKGHVPSAGSEDPFMRAMLRLSGQLTPAQRAAVLARVRQLATTRN